MIMAKSIPTLGSRKADGSMAWFIERNNAAGTAWRRGSWTVLEIPAPRGSGLYTYEVFVNGKRVADGLTRWSDVVEALQGKADASFTREGRARRGVRAPARRKVAPAIMLAAQQALLRTGRVKDAYLHNSGGGPWLIVAPFKRSQRYLVVGEDYWKEGPQGASGPTTVSVTIYNSRGVWNNGGDHARGAFVRPSGIADFLAPTPKRRKG